MASNLLLQDATLIQSMTLPTSASATTITTPLDTGNDPFGTGQGNFDPRVAQFRLTIPAMSTTALPGIVQNNFEVFSCLNSDGSSNQPEIQNLVSVPSSVATAVPFKLRFDIHRYIMIGVTNSGTTSVSTNPLNYATLAMEF